MNARRIVMVYLLYGLTVVGLCAVERIVDAAYPRFLYDVNTVTLLIEGVVMMVWGAFLIESGSKTWTRAETVVGFVVPALLMITMVYWWPYVPCAFRELAGNVAHDLARLGWMIIGALVFKWARGRSRQMS